MGLLTTVVKVYFLSISALSFPTMNHRDKPTVSTDILSQTEGRNGEFESRRSKPFLDPLRVGSKPIEPELISLNTNDLSRTPKEAKSSVITSDSEQILTELDIELEKDENYPTEAIEEALKSASSVVKEFLRRPMRVTLNSVGHRIAKRNTPDLDEFTQRLCPVRRSTFRPRNPRHSDEPGDERLYFPLNLSNRGEGLPEVFQAVETRTCKSVGLNTAVSRAATNFLQGHDSWCKQEYMSLPMVALVQNTTNLVITRIPFPTSCSCYLRS